MLCDYPEDQLQTLDIPFSSTLPSFVVRLGQVGSEQASDFSKLGGGQFESAVFDGDLDKLEAAELQTHVDVLQAMLRNPVGPDLIISKRAIAGALRIP